MTKHSAPGVLPGRTDRRTSSAVIALGVSVGLVVSGMLVWRGTEAAFRATTENGVNSWATGNLNLSDNDTNLALFSIDDNKSLVPGATRSRCITVTYTGTVAAPKAVKVYAKTVASDTQALDDHVLLTITEGSGSTDVNCTGFDADTTGDVTTFTAGTLTTFRTKAAYGDGVGAWVPPGTSTTRDYKITYTIGSEAPMNASSSLAFVWETTS